MKKLALVFVAVVGLGLVGASESVAQTFYSRGAARPTGIFSFNLGVGVNPYRGGHWNWYSGRYYRHGNHFHWSPGRMYWNSSPFYSRGPFGPYGNCRCR